MARRKAKDITPLERAARFDKLVRGSYYSFQGGLYHQGHIFNEADESNVYMYCTCGWAFQGTYSDLVVKWNNHVQYEYYSFPDLMHNKNKKKPKQKNLNTKSAMRKIRKDRLRRKDPEPKDSV
jgi:hypothetical protein